MCGDWRVNPKKEDVRETKKFPRKFQHAGSGSKSALKKVPPYLLPALLIWLTPSLTDWQQHEQKATTTPPAMYTK